MSTEREGGCHCGAVRFRVRMPQRPRLLRCNCSICRRTGYLHLIVPKADFTLLSGAESLTEYRFGSGSARHLFCRLCGIKSFYHPRSHPDGISVHFACLDEADAIAHDIVDFDGRNWETARAALDEESPSS